MGFNSAFKGLSVTKLLNFRWTLTLKVQIQGYGIGGTRPQDNSVSRLNSSDAHCA